MNHCVVLIGVLACFSCAKRSEPTGEAAPPVIRTPGGQEMVRIPAGQFTMGSDHGQADERPAHGVHVDSFFMDRTEVTQEMYEKLGLINPSKVKGARLPVHMMTWVLAARYCNARSKAEGLEACYNEDNATCDFTKNGYRLPTEAEWEYACRAGLQGDSPVAGNSSSLRALAWCADNSEGRPHPVGQKTPNAWGLVDMLGNAREWCNDIYDAAYYGKSPAENPRGPEQGDLYVVRGGAYTSSAQSLSPSARAGENPGFSDACLAPESLGFRCVRNGGLSSGH